jgi:hypothetical protein
LLSLLSLAPYAHHRSDVVIMSLVPCPHLGVLCFLVVSSAPGDEETRHLIKSQGPDTFTGRLLRLAKDAEASKKIIGKGLNPEGGCCLENSLEANRVGPPQRPVVPASSVMWPAICSVQATRFVDRLVDQLVSPSIGKPIGNTLALPFLWQ